MVGFYITDIANKCYCLLEAPYMIGKRWRKMDFHGGYAAYEEHKTYMMNSE